VNEDRHVKLKMRITILLGGQYSIGLLELVEEFVILDGVD
jgi:hypothetical protein